ncbi:hypothetical protein [Streptomyces sp. XD-27]|uniref:hypothetical protein n=1 Tax=Streptomyces sp. XD-27 TaxID=3062779 RepID=UPI0026F454C7|nr:hypothetical protein [Streptomyces sp. XD-27]WKX70336.1 hypothetical protein Q3Y56_10760 [Streptomyces sp. XD-27]
MNHTSPGGETPTPLSPLPLRHLSDVRRLVLTTRQLRAHGVTAATVAERSRAGGPWRQLLPGVHLLHPGPPTGEELLHAALLYVGRAPARTGATARTGTTAATEPVMVTGLAALALHHFSAAPPLLSLDHVDVLVPRTRRTRSVGYVRVVRGHPLPEPVDIAGVPTAPVARALTDAVARLRDATSVRRLLVEAVRGAHCETTAIVRELTAARLLTRPYVAGAVDALLAEARGVAEGQLYAMIRGHGLPEPLWNVELRMPGGPWLGGVDAYWPDQAVALVLDARLPQYEKPAPATGSRCEETTLRERLERLGITVVYATPHRMRHAPGDQAALVRTALMAAVDRDPAAYVLVLPR